MKIALETLVEHALNHAKNTLIGNKGAQIPPTFLFQFRDGARTMFVTPWRTDRDQAVTIAAIKDALKRFRPIVDSYSVVSEAWMAEQTTRPKPGDLMPRDREDRKEGVLISAFNKDGEGVTRTWEIKRGPDAAVTELVPHLDDKTFACGGNMVNLFGDDE